MSLTIRRTWQSLQYCTLLRIKRFTNSYILNHCALVKIMPCQTKNHIHDPNDLHFFPGNYFGFIAFNPLFLLLTSVYTRFYSKNLFTFLQTPMPFHEMSLSYVLRTAAMSENTTSSALKLLIVYCFNRKIKYYKIKIFFFNLIHVVFQGHNIPELI